MTAYEEKTELPDEIKKQFRDKVKETHGDSKYAQEYLMIADLMELHFGEGK